MSRASKLTLAATSVGTIGICLFVHYAQRSEKAAMHAGVIRDYEQQRLKRERQAEFEMQQELEKEYRKLQTVSAGNGPEIQDTSTNR
jgi:protein PET117